MMIAATGTKRRRPFGSPQDDPVPSHAGRRDARPGLDVIAARRREAGADQADAERHDQRMHAEDADADAVGETDERGGGEGDRDARHRRAGG